MKQEFGYPDEKLNQFKLMIYNWNINNAIEYYENDSFCLDFCISANDEHGCRKEAYQCRFEHSLTLNLPILILPNELAKPDYKMGKILCLYLMNKKIYNNSELFWYYGKILHKTGTGMQDYVKSGQYYSQSLNIDNNNDVVHYNYGQLLDENLYNFDKAEYHFQKSLQIDSSSVAKNYNFATFLVHKRQKYNESLMYINKACELQPNASENHELKGRICYKLNKYDESIDAIIRALKVNENDGWMTNFGRVDHAKQLLQLAINKYMTEELKIASYFNTQFDGYKLIEWLCDHQLLSIKKEIFLRQISLEILSQCNNKDLDDLIKEMKLNTTTRIRLQKAIKTLQPTQPQQEFEDESVESNAESNVKSNVESNLESAVQSKVESKDDQSTSNLALTKFWLSQHDEQSNHDDESKIDDAVSVCSGYSGISAISSPFVVNDALIVFLGIGDYENLPTNLVGVSKDYHNILNTFVETWGYTAFYKTDKNFSIYTNEIGMVKLNNNYKLNWSIDEIEKFVEEARMYVSFNKHNGLIFVIASHGDTGKIIYDSKMKEYALSDIFDMFRPECAQNLKTYKEAPHVSKRLHQIPKIFCIDSCRGSSAATIVDTEAKIDVHSENSDNNNNNNTNNNNYDEEIENSESEKNSSKVFAKKKGEILSSNYSNFCKIWANVDGYAVADGSLNGGLFLRNVSKLFQDKKWILNHNLTDIIFKIREYTKRDATLVGFVNFTQLVENEGTMEKPLRFDVFKDNIINETGQESLDKLETIVEESDDDNGL